MHAGAGLGDDAALTHAPRKEDLAEHIVDLVRAGVIELLALEVNLGAAAMLGETLGEIERRRPPHVMGQIAVHLTLKGRIGLGRGVSFFQLKHERHQRFGDKAPAIDAKMPALVRTGAERVELLHCHRTDSFRPPACWAARAERMKAMILSMSFTPGERSTPDETSMPAARVIRNASPTFCASSPPDSMNGTLACTFSSSRQSKVLPSPPGRVASRGARASNNNRSATSA